MYDSFDDIPQFVKCSYAVDVHFQYVGKTIDDYIREEHLNMNPDFQRPHVWTREQQSRYIEFLLHGGRSGRDIYFNHPGWNAKANDEFVIVDGKQRIQAIRQFVDNKIPAFGKLMKEYKGSLRIFQGLRFHIADLPTRKQVLQWYLDLNSGGVVHSAEELDRIRRLLVQEDKIIELYDPHDGVSGCTKRLPEKWLEFANSLNGTNMSRAELESRLNEKLRPFDSTWSYRIHNDQIAGELRSGGDDQGYVALHQKTDNVEHCWRLIRFKED